MSQQRNMNEQSEKPKIVMPQISLAEAAEKPSHYASSVPSTPALRKHSSVKMNCLCSPTTHAGSFRCRYHRTAGGGLTRNSMSVGSKLSELAGKQTRICDGLHAQ